MKAYYRNGESDVDSEAREWLAKKGYLEVYGARAIAQVRDGDTVFICVARDAPDIRDNRKRDGLDEMMTSGGLE